MAEPLSTAASTIAVVGFAAESSKLVFRFFHDLAHMPAYLHDSFLALNSLHVTLDHLQEHGARPNAKYRFSAHFCDRINECLKDLKAFEVQIAEIDAIFGRKAALKRDWNGKARRSWERMRWLIVGEQETKRFLEKIKIYQNEFFLELLMLLT